MNRRLAAIEAKLAGLEAGVAKMAAQVTQDATRWLSFGEIVRGQAVLAHAYDGNPAKALEAGDLTMVALIAVAELRRRGVEVGPLFPEAEAGPS